ncbi:MAG: monovalent cation/H+ antiporter subunit D [Burkholderiales bacterium]
MNAWIDAAMPHLVIAPVALPLATAVLLLLMRESNRRAKAVLDTVACVLGLGIAVALAAWTGGHGASSALGVYLPSNWRAPFGIVLAVDRLAAMMLVLAALLALAAVLFAIPRWHQAGVHFHALVQLQLMGVNGAFLTADLFNLFVFFEVMLAASYGLLLHGSGRARVGAGLKYITVNLVASSLFLIGVAVVYGTVGTLNYADIAQKIVQVPAGDRGLLHAGIAILGIAFLAKAAMWPLNFWLVPAYRAASPPAAALFVILTKVGVYVVLRLWTLLVAADPAAMIGQGSEALFAGGVVTLAFGAIGMLAARGLRALAGYAVIMSSGTLIAAAGLGIAPLIGGALYYLAGSTLGASALFLLAELTERTREFEAAPPARDTADARQSFYLDLRDEREPGAFDDTRDAPLIGQPIPAATAFLGMTFVLVALLIAGLPPLSGFLAKFAMIGALLAGSSRDLAAAGTSVATAHALFVALLVLSGFATLIAMSRAGIRWFWAPRGCPAPHLRVIECVPVAMFLAAFAVLAIRAGPVFDYTRAAAAGIVDPARYVDAVMSATPVAAAAVGPPALASEAAR